MTACTYIHTYGFTYLPRAVTEYLLLVTCAYIRTYIRMYVHTVCAYVRMYVCTYVHMYLLM